MRRFWKSPWALALVPVVLGTILTAIYDAIKDKPILSTLWEGLKTVFGWVISFLNFELKVWWVLLGIALIIVALIIIAKIYVIKSNPSFLSYTKDSVLGYTWEWEYKKTYDGKYTICNLHPVCSNCGMRLKQVGIYRGQMECLRCDASYIWEDSYLNDAQMLIEDNIKKNYIQNQ